MMGHVLQGRLLTEGDFWGSAVSPSVATVSTPSWSRTRDRSVGRVVTRDGLYLDTMKLTWGAELLTWTNGKQLGTSAESQFWFGGSTESGRYTRLHVQPCFR